MYLADDLHMAPFRGNLPIIPRVHRLSHSATTWPFRPALCKQPRVDGHADAVVLTRRKRAYDKVLELSACRLAWVLGSSNYDRSSWWRTPLTTACRSCRICVERNRPNSFTSA